ncbi:Uncharacterised protein [BD1-7 clade bacterium]|uniref:DUF3014 domain-containing protein n=1 Tax=BD1-7 clade bacterium TaxID=2029982 RepID=A0A5S9N0C7_9GAMM|nr:Uncharacterised protein [BD1-7 clade bacterium]
MKSSTAVAVVAVLALFAVYWFYTRPAEEAPETVMVEEVTPIQTIDRDDAVMLPETPAVAPQEENDDVWLEYNAGTLAMPDKLDNSDQQAKDAVQDLSPSLTQWLAKNELIRRVVMNVNVLAGDQLPETYPFFAYAMAPFKVLPTANGDTFVADPVNHSRAKPLVDALVGIDAKKLVAYYNKWQPRLDDAYAELGRKGTFNGRVNTALDTIVAAKPLPSKAVLKRDNVFYEYQDPALENAGAIQKWLWRLGPDNQKAVQAYASQVKSLLKN